MHSNSVQQTQAPDAAAGGGVQGATAAQGREVKATRQGALTVVALVWGFWFLLLGVLMLNTTPVGGTVTAALGLLGWAFAFHLLANGN